MNDITLDGLYQPQLGSPTASEVVTFNLPAALFRENLWFVVAPQPKCASNPIENGRLIQRIGVKTMTDRGQRLLIILESHGRRIHTLLTRLTLCESTAEDLLQDLFVRLSKSDHFDLARDQTAYAMRAATNLAFEWRRKQKRMIHSQSLTDEPIAQNMSPEDMLVQKEQCAHVLQALDCLSQLSRYVVIQHRLQGQSYDAIASELDKTPHQVRAICCKAIDQLRDLLGSSSSACREESK